MSRGFVSSASFSERFASADFERVPVGLIGRECFGVNQNGSHHRLNHEWTVEDLACTVHPANHRSRDAMARHGVCPCQVETVDLSAVAGTTRP